jgi:phosphate transport system ATP-binding protein
MTEVLINIKDPVLKVRNLSISYGGEKAAVKNVDFDIERKAITSIMGPSGCGKSTLLRAVNRMHELYPSIKTSGEIFLDDQEIHSIHATEVRRKIGMVFQRPNPFPSMSIYDNVLAAYRLNGISLKRSEKDEIVENSLKNVSLWDEVKDSLFRKGSFLSGGQQQRLCIARAIAFNPDILLLDEPTSALDPIATSKIEELLITLKKDYTILLVTHNISQAGRISDNSIFMYLGELVEYGRTETMFTNPSNPKTEAYLTGKFG